jgi:hypothetical protein
MCSSSWYFYPEATISKKEREMEELASKLIGQERFLGRKVIWLVPILMVITLSSYLYFSLPVRYFFSVRGGELCLMAGRFSRVDAVRCQSIEPVPVAGLDVGSLTAVVFEHEGEAVNEFKSFFVKRVNDQTAKVLPMERELAAPYGALLRDLKAAKSAGVEGLQKNIDVIQGWMDIYKKKTELK